MTNLEKELTARVAVLRSALDAIVRSSDRAVAGGPGVGSEDIRTLFAAARHALSLVPAAALAEIRAEAFEEAAVAVDPPFKMGHSPSDALRRVAEDERSIATAASKCGVCDGTGTATDPTRNDDGNGCRACGGTGERRSDFAERRERAVVAAVRAGWGDDDRYSNNDSDIWLERMNRMRRALDAALAVLAGEEE